MELATTTTLLKTDTRRRIENVVFGYYEFDLQFDNDNFDPKLLEEIGAVSIDERRKTGRPRKDLD